MIRKLVRVLMLSLAAAAGFGLSTQISAHDEGPPHHARIPAHATPAMRNKAYDQLAPQALPSVAGSTVACSGGVAAGYDCSNVDLMSFLPLDDIGGIGAMESANDIWGWTDAIGREIAIIGLYSGTAFVDISDPENPVYLGKLPANGENSLWRDIKVYADHAYIVSEGDDHGMQVFDLSVLPPLGSETPLTPFQATFVYNEIGSAHNIAINEDSGYAYIVGANGGLGDNCNRGLHIVDLETDPAEPTFAGCFSADGYTHDVQCVIYDGPDNAHDGKEICFAANEDTVTIVDVTNKGNPVQLNRVRYNGSRYTHQGWLTEDHRYFLLDDELDESRLGHNTITRIIDLRNLDAHKPKVTVYTHDVGSIDHNQYVVGDYSYQANYRAGLRILDVSNPTNPSLAGYFDIFIGGNGTGFNGAWSVYPFFDSQNVIVSGIEQGLYVLRPDLGITPPDDPIEMHLHELTKTSSTQRGRFTANAHVTIYDDNESAVEGASVTGSFAPGGDTSCTTNGAGQCTLTVSFKKNTGTDDTMLTDVDVSRGSDAYIGFKVGETTTETLPLAFP